MTIWERQKPLPELCDNCGQPLDYVAMHEYERSDDGAQVNVLGCRNCLLHSPGEWYVIRNCCVSGMCLECTLQPPDRRPMRVIQTKMGATRTYAARVARNWKSHEAVVVKLGATHAER